MGWLTSVAPPNSANHCPWLLLVSSCTAWPCCPGAPGEVGHSQRCSCCASQGLATVAPSPLSHCSARWREERAPSYPGLSCTVCRTPQPTHLQLPLHLPHFRSYPCAPHWALCCWFKLPTSAPHFNNYHQVLRKQKQKKNAKQTSWPKGNKVSEGIRKKTPSHLIFHVCVSLFSSIQFFVWIV